MPEESQNADAGTQTSEPTDAPAATPSGQPETQDAQTPVTYTQEQVNTMMDGLAKRMQNDIQAWAGRRDKQLLTRVEEMMSTRPVTGTQQSYTPDTNAEFDWNNPMASISRALPSVIKQYQQQEATAAQKYRQNVADAIMDEISTNDTYIRDGKANEIGKQIFNKIDWNNIPENLPPHTAAQFLLQSAENKYYREQSQGRNALSHNTPAKTPTGSLTPPPGQGLPQKDLKLPDLSETTRKYQKFTGMSDEQLAKIFKEKGV